MDVGMKRGFVQSGKECRRQWMARRRGEGQFAVTRMLSMATRISWGENP